MKAKKNLGVHINENLSWIDRISYISNKLSKGIAILYHVSSINIDALRNLYCTLILPYLSYCAMVWGNTYTTNLMPLYRRKKPLGLYVMRNIEIILQSYFIILNY